MPSWKENWALLAETFLVLGQGCGHVWDARVPLNRPPPPEASEKEIDVEARKWIPMIVSGQGLAFLPAVEARPWLLARLSAATIVALNYGKSDEAPPVELSEMVLNMLLVNHWHNLAREAWDQFGGDHSSFPG